MYLVTLLGRLFFILGGLVLLLFGMLFARNSLSLILPVAGVYFMARGACFLGVTLQADK